MSDGYYQPPRRTIAPPVPTKRRVPPPNPSQQATGENDAFSVSTMRQRIIEAERQTTQHRYATGRTTGGAPPPPSTDSNYVTNRNTAYLRQTGDVSKQMADLAQTAQPFSYTKLYNAIKDDPAAIQAMANQAESDANKSKGLTPKSAGRKFVDSAEDLSSWPAENKLDHQYTDLGDGDTGDAEEEALHKPVAVAQSILDLPDEMKYPGISHNIFNPDTDRFDKSYPEIDPNTTGPGMRPKVKNPMTFDDIQGYTAHPVLKQICFAKTYRLKNYEYKGGYLSKAFGWSEEVRNVQKFEISVDDKEWVLLHGQEKADLWNGYFVSLLTFGVFKEKFQFSLYDNAHQHVIEARRGVTTSNFINIYFHYYGETIKAGMIQPRGFSLSRLNYDIYKERPGMNGKRARPEHLYTFRSYMKAAKALGLASKTMCLVPAGRDNTVLAKLKWDGELVMKKDAMVGKNRIPLEHRMLVLACSLIMQMDAKGKLT